jgi:hypothetical protein
MLVLSKAEKMYSLENTDIPKVFLTPHHVGHCCSNMVRGHCCAAMLQRLLLFALLCSSSDLPCCCALLCEKRNRHGDGSIGCSSVTLEREERQSLASFRSLYDIS